MTFSIANGMGDSIDEQTAGGPIRSARPDLLPRSATPTEGSTSLWTRNAPTRDASARAAHGAQSR